MNFMKSSAIVLVFGLTMFCVNAKSLVCWVQADNQSTPSYLSSRVAYVETLPFDGITICAGSPRTTMNNVLLDYNTIYVSSGLSTLGPKFTKFKQNYLMVYCNKPCDFFSDWSITAKNFALYAKAAKAAGFAGIFFDNEEYQRKLWAYPSAVDSSSKYSLTQYRAQTLLRGKQVMEAMVAEFPAIRVITMHGPYVSENRPSFVNMRQTGGPADYELMGSFFVGMVEGKGASGTCIDGGEVYQLRTVTQFEQSYNWRKNVIASSTQNSPNIPADLRNPAWPGKVSIAFGLYNGSWPDPVADAMSPTIMRTTAENALKRADDLAWYYSEGQAWYDQGSVSQAWIDAFKGARDAVNTTTTTMSPISQAKESPYRIMSTDHGFSVIGAMAGNIVSLYSIAGECIDSRQVSGSGSVFSWNAETKSITPGMYVLTIRTAHDFCVNAPVLLR